MPLPCCAAFSTIPGPPSDRAQLDSGCLGGGWPAPTSPRRLSAHHGGGTRVARLQDDGRGRGVAMPSQAFAAPLIVWLGPRRYTFPAGRDVTVGRDSRADIRLDGVGTPASPTHMVLHHDGRQWIAVDRSEGGIYVDGVRMSTVFIHDGRAITLGDPERGPRLVFQLGAPPPPPPVAPPRPPRGAPRPGMRPTPPPGMRPAP